MKDKRKKGIELGVITTEPFPIGLAATNRMLSYIKVLNENNINVKVYISKPTELKEEIRNQQPKGNYQGVKFEYLHGYTVWPKQYSKIRKILILLNGVIFTIQALKKDNPESIIMSGMMSSPISLILRLSILVQSKIYNFKLYQEMSEYPPELNKKKGIGRFIGLKLYTLFDGLIVMTNELKNYFSGIGQKNIFHLPMTVDIDRFSIEKNTHNKKKYFAYCGGGNYERDGVLALVESFIRFSKLYPTYELYIIGDKRYDCEYFKKIVETIRNNKLTQKVKFLGRKQSKEIPELLINAECLLVTPQENFKSGGFPTKLGEYLATGVPVICTNVSEIPQYLDEKSALLIEPNNLEQLLSAMKKIEQERRECREIGRKGKEIAKEFFSVEPYVVGLKEFLFNNDLCNR